MNNEFLNVTNHSLTTEQRESAIKEFSVTKFSELKDINPELFERLSNSPSEEVEVFKLALEFLDYLRDISNDINKKGGKLIIHFPIGSPALNFAVAGLITTTYASCHFKIVFSHSERVVKEKILPDGTVVKESVFSFMKFIKAYNLF